MGYWADYAQLHLVCVMDLGMLAPKIDLLLFLKDNKTQAYLFKRMEIHLKRFNKEENEVPI